MTAGIPSDMRRTALVSLVAHVAALVALTTVPLTKIPPPETKRPAGAVAAAEFPTTRDRCSESDAPE